MSLFQATNISKSLFLFFFLRCCLFLEPSPVDAADLPHRMEEANLEIKNLNATLFKIINASLPKNVIVSPNDLSNITTTGHDQVYPLSFEKALEICSRNLTGDEIRHNTRGNHAVSAGEGIHFKVSDSNHTLDSGYDRAAYYFHKYLVGEGVTPSTFCVLNNVKLLKKQQPKYEQFMVQSSLTVNGEPLNNLLERCTIPSSVEFDVIKNTSVSAWILTSFLTCPNDAKDDNFIIETKDASYNLISIDSDMINFYPYSYQEYSDSTSELNIVFRNVLFFLPKFMNAEPDETAKNKILTTNANEFLYYWLSSLDKLNKDYKAFLEMGAIDKKTYKNENFPIEFSLSTIQDVALQLKKLQFWLARGGTCSDLLRNIHPLVYYYYQKLMKNSRHPKQPWKNLTTLYTTPPSIDDFLESKTTLKMKDGRTLEEVIAEEKIKTKSMYEEDYEPVNIILKTIFPYGLTDKKEVKNADGLPPLGIPVSPSEEAFIEAYESDAWDDITWCSLPESNISMADGHILREILKTKKNELERINLYFNYLTVESLDWLNPILENQINLIDLNLCDNDLKEDGIAWLTRIFIYLPLLESLNISGNNLQNKGMKVLWEASNHTLQKLKFIGLAENQLSDDGNSYISTFIKDHQSLEEVDLRWNKLTGRTGNTLLPLTLKHQNLCVISLKGNTIPSSIKEILYISLVRRIVSFIGKETEDNTKNKYYNFLENFNFKCTPRPLPTLKKLILGATNKLNLHLNEDLNPLSISLIKEVIGITPLLKKMYIFYSLYKSDTINNHHIKNKNLFIESLYEKIIHCPNLTTVYYSGFKISDFLFLIKGIKDRTAVKRLGFRFAEKENCNTPLAIQLVTEIGTFKNLRELDLSFNGIQNKLAFAIGDMIPKLPFLEFLDLRGNIIEETGTKALCEGQMIHPSLKTLLLKGQKK